MKKLIAFAVAASVLAASVFAEEEKHALLIANGEYTHFSGLSEPVKEAENLRVALEQIGFSVKVVKNASLEIMNDALADFEAVLKKSGGIGFFHYGGHAVQVAGKNYLIPSTADIPDERRVSTRALNVDEVMNSMVADTNIIVLDSCRNNPLPAGSGRSASRGLVISSVRPKNSIIVYSAEAGCTARDGVFTPALTKEITKKTNLQLVLINVRNEVQRLTNGEQTPGEYSQLAGMVFLAGQDEQTAIASLFTPAAGDLLVKSGMAADVYIDGNKVGYVTESNPFLQKNIIVGTYKVELRNKTSSSIKVVYVGKNETAKINFETEQIHVYHDWKYPSEMGSIFISMVGAGFLGWNIGRDKNLVILGGTMIGVGFATLLSMLFIVPDGHYETRFVSALEKDSVLKNVCFTTNGMQTTIGYKFTF